MTARERLTAHLGWKVFLTILLNLWVCIPYFWLQRHPLFPVVELTPSWFDRSIRFDVTWVWAYQSLYLLTPIAPWLATDLQMLRRYALGLAGVSLACDLVFLAWPTTVARPVSEVMTPLYGLLVSYDRPGNALPSLHAALAAYSALCCAPLVAASRRPRLWGGLLLTWVAFIIYATLATKQHVAVDALAGISIGVLGYAAAFRLARAKASGPVEGVMSYKKLALKSLIGLGVVLVAALGFVVAGQVDHETDRRELLKMRDAYEAALNQGKVDEFMALVDADFKGTMATSLEIEGAAEWKAHWQQVKDLVGIGRGGKYSVKVNPVPMGTMFVSDVAVSFGTTDESVTPVSDGKEIKFSSSWIAVSRKRGDSWKLASCHVRVLDPSVFAPEKREAIAKLVAEFQLRKKG